MLDQLAQDYQSALENAEKNNASQRELKKAYDASFDSLVAMADKLGMTTKEAEAYARTVLGLPSDYTFQIHDNTDEAKGRIQALRERAEALSAQHYYLRITALEDRVPTGGGGGGGRAEANGGIVTARADGGFDAAGGYVPRVSQIARGGRTIMWAEPETGWEAYISGKPGMEARNRDIWREAGRRLGLAPAGGGSVVSRTVVVNQLPSRVTLEVDGHQFTAFVRVHASDVARAEIDSDMSYQAGVEGMRR